MLSYKIQQEGLSCEKFCAILGCGMNEECSEAMSDSILQLSVADVQFTMHFIFIQILGSHETAPHGETTCTKGENKTGGLVEGDAVTALYDDYHLAPQECHRKIQKKQALAWRWDFVLQMECDIIQLLLVV